MTSNEAADGLKPRAKGRGARPSTGSGRTETPFVPASVDAHASGGTPFVPSEAEGRAPHTPERTCVLTREHGSRDTLIRLALSPDGIVAPDTRARAPGRGAWIGVDRATLEQALAKGKLKGALMRAFKTQVVTIPADLPQRLEEALQRDCLDRLGLEARGGTLVTGGARIEEAARAGRVRLLLHADDAGDDGRRRLDQAWRVGSDREGSGRQGLIIPAGRAILSLALGRENVVSVGLVDGGAAARVMHALERWRRYIGRDEANMSRGVVAGEAIASGDGESVFEGTGD